MQSQSLEKSRLCLRKRRKKEEKRIAFITHQSLSLEAIEISREIQIQRTD